jgi:hypothetical protein
MMARQMANDRATAEASLLASTRSQSASQAIADFLTALGVRHAFGVSGGAIAAIWGALSASAIEVAHFRHESGAAFAAIEAHFITGAPVVVFTTTGPELTNSLTGILAARGEGAKIILLSACTTASNHLKSGIKLLSGCFAGAASDRAPAGSQRDCPESSAPGCLRGAFRPDRGGIWRRI